MNEKQNYLLGWLACDGHFDDNGSTIGLQIQERDKAILPLFITAFGGKLDPTPRLIKGRQYFRWRVHKATLWTELVTLFNARLKKDKLFPYWADTNFVIGCFDADGSFYIHHDMITGEFQHASINFIDGITRWLRERSIGFTRRAATRLTLNSTSCHKLGEYYKAVPWALVRKAHLALYQKQLADCYWTPRDLEFLTLNYKHWETNALSLYLNRTVKAIRLKAFRLGLCK